MYSENSMMYDFKGRLMKEISRKVTKNVSISIFYKEDANFVGVILSTPDSKEDNSRLYRIADPWTMIQENISISPCVERIVGQYKAHILSKYFKGEKYEEK